MDSKRAKAPWPDYRGAEIYDGDTIIHPSGETGTVVYIPHPPEVGRNVDGDSWFVDYGTRPMSRLSLQIGNKGQACVLATKKSQASDRECCYVCRFGFDAMFGVECRKHAPLVRVVDPCIDIRQFVPVFPVMNKGEWCGDFEAKEGGNA